MKRLLRRLTGAVASAALTNLIIVGLALLTSVLVARALGADGRGEFAAVFSVFTIAMTVGELGQSAAVTYRVAAHPDEVGAAVAAGRRIMVLTTTAVSLIMLLVVFITVERGLLPAYTIALAGCLVNALGAPYLYATQAAAFAWWNRLRLVQPVVYLVLVAGLFAWGGLTVSSLTCALTISTAIGLVAASLLGRRMGMTGARPDRSLVRSMGRYGAFAASAGIPISLGQNLDKILLLPMAGATFVGHYAVATTVAALGQPIATAIGSVALPTAARTTDPGELRLIGRQALTRGATATVGVSLALALIAPWLIPVVFGPSFSGAAELVWVLLPGMALRCVNLVMTSLLRGVHKPGKAAAAQITAALVFLALLAPLHLLLGDTGIGVSLAIAELLGLALGVAAWRGRASTSQVAR